MNLLFLIALQYGVATALPVVPVPGGGTTTGGIGGGGRRYPHGPSVSTRMERPTYTRRVARAADASEAAARKAEVARQEEARQRRELQERQQDLKRQLDALERAARERELLAAKKAKKLAEALAADLFDRFRAALLESGLRAKLAAEERAWLASLSQAAGQAKNQAEYNAWLAENQAELNRRISDDEDAFVLILSSLTIQ